MTNTNIRIKIRHGLRLFYGLKDPQIKRALAPFGLTKAVLDDGLARLVTADVLRADGTVVIHAEPTRLARLAELNGTWFPIARVVLEGRFPDVAEQLFLNLAQEQGREATLATAAFTARLGEMADPEGRFGADGPAARALLAERGLTAEVEAEARGLLATLTDEEAPLPPDTEAERAATLAAYAWYREWRTIARVAIKDKRLRRKLGFVKRRPADEEETAVLATAVPVVTTAVTTAPTLPTPVVPPALAAPVTTVAERTLPALVPIAAE